MGRGRRYICTEKVTLLDAVLEHVLLIILMYSREVNICPLITSLYLTCQLWGETRSQKCFDQRRRNKNVVQCNITEPMIISRTAFQMAVVYFYRTRFGHKAKLLFRFWAEGLVKIWSWSSGKILKLKFGWYSAADFWLTLRSWIFVKSRFWS